MTCAMLRALTKSDDRATRPEVPLGGIPAERGVVPQSARTAPLMLTMFKRAQQGS
jgi:hypothetical protein